MGKDKDKCLLASDAGYGFITQLSERFANKKAGNTVLNESYSRRVLHPCPIINLKEDIIAVLSNEGRLLVFPATELPEMARGKGNKMMSIPSARVQDRSEYVLDMQVLGPDDTLLVYSGKRHLSLKPADLQHYL